MVTEHRKHPLGVTEMRILGPNLNLYHYSVWYVINLCDFYLLRHM